MNKYHYSRMIAILRYFDIKHLKLVIIEKIILGDIWVTKGKKIAVWLFLSLAEKPCKIRLHKNR
jgi:hypothetical protein